MSKKKSNLNKFIEPDELGGIELNVLSDEPVVQEYPSGGEETKDESSQRSDNAQASVRKRKGAAGGTE